MTNSTQEWNSLRAKLSKYLSVYDAFIPSLREVNTIPDAPICGGGKLTLALDGTNREVNYHITKADFWVDVPQPQSLFPKFGFKPVSLCRLNLTIRNAAEEGARHVQDMAGAEIRSEFRLASGVLHVRSVALAQRDLALFELQAEGATVEVTIRLQTDNEDDNFFILEGSDDAMLWLRKEHKAMVAVNAAAALRIDGARDIRPVYERGERAAATFEVPVGKVVRLVFCAKGGKDEYDAMRDARAELARVSGRVPARLLEEHAAWWKNFWLKSWIEIGDEAIERFYYGAQYVLGCSIDLESRVVPGIAGGWITSAKPIWGGGYYMNYNGEAPFWGLPSSNRGEFLMPYVRACLDFIPTGRLMAHELKTRGIVMPVMMGPWGLGQCDALGQKSNASMAAMSMIWHYEFTLDRAFLKECLYPYLRELAAYWEDNLIPDRSGRYVIEEAAVWERTPGDLNPAEDLVYAARIFRTLLAGAAELGLDKSRRAQWQRFIDRLSECPVTLVGDELCFNNAENLDHRVIGGPGANVVALNKVYPGGLLDEGSARDGILARNTLRYLQSWNQENSFTRVFSQAVRAGWPGGEILDLFKQRLTRGPGPHEILRRNNTFLPKDHSFEGTAGTEFINTMLAHAHGGVLKVFDAWPRDRDAAFARIRVRGAFLVSGSLRGGEVESVGVVSEQGGTCRMKSCWPGRGIVVKKLAGRASSAVKVSRAAGAFEWKTVRGGVYRVTAGAAVAEETRNPPVMLVPVLEPAARTAMKYTDAAVDILLKPDLGHTQLEVDVVYADETRRRCTAQCRFRSRDPRVARVGARGAIAGKGRGRTVVDVTALIDGVRLSHAVSVYVLKANILPDVTATMLGKKWRSWGPTMHSLECLVGGKFTDRPDLNALHRANSYGFGLFAAEPEEGRLSITFDLGAVHAVDELWVWNYNCPDNYRVLWWCGGTAVGMRDVMIEHSKDGAHWKELKTEGHPFRLARATGEQWMPATNLDDGKNSPIRFHGARARYVRLAPNLEIGLGNWGGERFGLSQVRFTRKRDA